MRARGAAALAVLFALAGCDSGQIKESSLPPPHIISGPLIVPSACASRTQSPDHPGGPSLAVDPTNPRQLVATWEAPAVLESLTAPPAQPDKDAILADPRRPGVAYAVWVEYPVAENAQPSVDRVVFARTTDAGHTWSKPASIYSGNDEAQEHQLLMTAGGVLLDVFVEGSSLPRTAHPPPLPVKIRVMRSTNQGQTWSQPIDAASFTYTNATDPGTGGQLGFFGHQITAAAAGNAVYAAWFEDHRDFSTIL